jgi:Post-segregation antitoxin CcdA.
MHGLIILIQKVLPINISKFKYYMISSKYMSYITVSTKVKKQIVDKAKEYGINISETLRSALEKEVRKKEIEWAIATMEEISKKTRLQKEAKVAIREFRDK